MDLTQENIQSNSPPPERQPEGVLGQGINTVNRVVGGVLPNPLAHGSKLKTAAKAVVKSIGRFIAANPWIWAVFTTILVSVITFLISMFTFFFQ